MVGYHSPQVEVSVRLNTNESPFPPPAAFAAEVAEFVAALDWNRYPDRSAHALRSRLAELLEVPADRVFAANGSNEVLQTLLLTYAGPGRKVMTFEPTYALHSHIATIVGSEVVSLDRNDAFAINLPEALDVITTTQPNVVFLCSPNNPSGCLLYTSDAADE